MKKRRLTFSDSAMADIVEQADWYAAKSSERVARRWEKSVTSAVALIAKRPDVGASCSFRFPELQDLRRVPISPFPKHLLFYRFDDEEVFIVRTVHGARDFERLFSS